MTVDEKYIPLVEAVLMKIRTELDRLYWNANQEEMLSPFDNTGEEYSDDIITIRAYNWKGNHLPNFECGPLKVWWYKYAGRGTYAECDCELTADVLAETIGRVFASMERNFEKRDQKDEEI